MKAMIRSRVMNSAFTSAKDHPDEQDHPERQSQGRPAQRQLARNGRRHKHDRADRQIHAAGQQHERHAEGHNAGRRRLHAECSRGSPR